MTLLFGLRNENRRLRSNQRRPAGLPAWTLIGICLVAFAVATTIFASEAVLPVQGDFEPDSRAYSNDPGKIRILGHNIHFNECESARFEVLKNERRNDSNWLGQSPERGEARTYALLAVVIVNGTQCEGATGQVWEFRVPANSVDEISVKIFADLQEYKNDESSSWGIYIRAAPNNSLEHARKR